MSCSECKPYVKTVLHANSPYVPADRDAVILFNATGGNIVCNWPSCADRIGDERLLIRIDENYSANVALNPAEGETIGGVSSWNLFHPGMAIWIVATEGGWQVGPTRGLFGEEGTLGRIQFTKGVFGHTRTLDAEDDVALTDNDFVVLLDGAEGGCNIYLLEAASRLDQIMIFTKIGTDYNEFTLKPWEPEDVDEEHPADTINGLAELGLTSPGQSLILKAVAGGWVILASYTTSDIIESVRKLEVDILGGEMPVVTPGDRTVYVDASDWFPGPGLFITLPNSDTEDNPPHIGLTYHIIRTDFTDRYCYLDAGAGVFVDDVTDVSQTLYNVGPGESITIRYIAAGKWAITGRTSRGDGTVRLSTGGSSSTVTLKSWTLADNEALAVELEILAKVSGAAGTTNRAAWLRKQAMFECQGGTASQIGPTSSTTYVGDTGCTATIDLSGNDVRVRFTGVADVNFSVIGTFKARRLKVLTI